MAEPKLIYQFRITLQHCQPAIWRRIQVPEHYTFWDLHVAIQDAMGWLDCHLHAFRIYEDAGSRKRPVPTDVIGIPDQSFGDDDTLPGWDTPLTDYFDLPGDRCEYLYDFGDDWLHDVLLEGLLLREPKVKYPRCLDGERACPPEDCGGWPGYEQLLDTLKRPRSNAYRDTKDWLQQHAKAYWPYDPAHFDAAQVKFANPARRWKATFSDE